MSTEIKVLSHACLFVKTDSASVIIDPWLIGSCYWSSWWNFPKPVFDESEIRNVDAVLISHIHWDHWHGPTLKKFFKDSPVISCNDPNPRSKRDLKSIGISSITNLSHSKSTSVGDIKITFYNFGLFLTDSAIIIEAGGTTILNANDAKIAGGPLQAIVNKHGPIDFALRSHSSANARICYEIPSDKQYVNDDREHYFKSFKLFMDNVQPRFAVPFASNHCHLTDDTYKFNQYISDPIELRNYISENYKNLAWGLEIMLPGSSWTSDRGFSPASEESFDDKLKTIDTYKESVAHRIEFYAIRESKIEIDQTLLNRFLKFLRQSNAHPDLKSVRFLITKNNAYSYSFLLKGRTIKKSCDESDIPTKGCAVIVMPNVVFRDAIIKNMFHHAAISKRCRYIAYDHEDMKKLKKFLYKLERHELTGDIGMGYIIKLLISYIGRWRELFVYIYALYLHKAKGLETYQIEEKVLSK